MKKNKLNVAVIGVGNMGRHHARVYHENKNVNLVAIVDIDKEKREHYSNIYNCKNYKSSRELIRHEYIDAVSIAVPTNKHYEVASTCIDAKIDCLVEKPIAHTISEAKKIYNLAKKNKVKLTIGHIERYNPAIVNLKKIIYQGQLGDIITISSRRLGLPPLNKKDIGVILDIGIHDIDIICDLRSEELEKIYTLKGNKHTKKNLDYAQMLLSFKKGVSASIEANWLIPTKIRQLTVTGTRGYAEIDYLTQRLRIFKINKPASSYKTYKEFISKFSTPDYQDIEFPKAEPLVAEIQNFINYSQNKTAYLVTPQEAIRALKIALLASTMHKTMVRL